MDFDDKIGTDIRKGEPTHEVYGKKKKPGRWGVRQHRIQVDDKQCQWGNKTRTMRSYRRTISTIEDVVGRGSSDNLSTTVRNVVSA